MKHLFLEDLKKMTVPQVKEHLRINYDATKEELKNLDVLIAYESVGSWGCDSSSFFLFKNKETGELFDNYGSHCSCYGFEGQFKPEPTTIEYLKSDKFSFYCGGYDSNETENQKAVKEYLKKMK